MDPNANLEEQLRLAESILNEEAVDTDDLIRDSQRLAELVQALDEWINNGGFLPTAWRKV